MQKLFLNVAAILVSGALVILAQAPPGPSAQGNAAPVPAAPAPTGPDAEATNLVTRACGSCHSLDRVKNKTGDKDAWNSTVTRMMDKGAALTDQQVPLVVDFLT